MGLTAFNRARRMQAELVENPDTEKSNGPEAREKTDTEKPDKEKRIEKK